MSTQVQCPNCGGSQTIRNPGIKMVVCEYCSTTLYWDQAQILHSGAKSILPAADTRLYDGAEGTLDGTPFEVVGHVRYAHPSGHWDEWYLEVQGQGAAWLSEDERELFLERPVPPEGTEFIPAFELAPGKAVELENTPFTVRETGAATCVGGWGQLPFTVLPGEQYPYADLASTDGTRFATLEYDNDGTPRAFVGTPLKHEQLVVRERAGAEFTAAQQQTTGIQCASCGAPLERPDAGREIQTLGCAYCGAQNDLGGAAARVMGKNPADFEAGFEFDIGARAEFDGTAYEVCGRMLSDDGEGYQTRLYLLWHAERGYRYLQEEDGEYCLLEATLQAPARDPFSLDEGDQVSVAGKRFRFVEQGRMYVGYVDGAFPWRVAVGEHSDYADFEAGKEVYGAERSGDEIEYFRGYTLPTRQVRRAFGEEVKTRPLLEKLERIEYRFSAFAVNAGLIGLVLTAATVPWLGSQLDPVTIALSALAFAVFGVFTAATPTQNRNNTFTLLCWYLAFSLPLAVVLGVGLLMWLYRRLWLPLPQAGLIVAYLIVPFSLMIHFAVYLETQETPGRETLEAAGKLSRSLDLLATRMTSLHDREAWMRDVAPDSRAWPGTVETAQGRLAVLRQGKLAELEQLVNHGAVWNVAGIPPLSADIRARFRDIAAPLKRIEDKFNALTAFKGNLLKNLKRYREHYEQTQPAYLQEVRERMEQALHAWPDAEVRQTLSAAAPRPPVKDNSKAARELWQQHLDAYQSARKVVITPAVYQDLPKAWKRMAELAKPNRDSVAKLMPLLDQLYTHWSEQLVDMRIDEGHEVLFYHTYRTVEARLDKVTPGDEVRVHQREVKVDKTTYNRMEPFMGMTVAYKPAGVFDRDARKVHMPVGYSVLANPAQGQNRFGHWENNQEWVWATGFLGLGMVFWDKFYQPKPDQVIAFKAAGKETYLGGRPPLFGNLGSFSRARYADSQYYRNNMFKNTRYIRSGRAWRGTRYEESDGGYRGASSSGSRSNWGK